MSVSQQWNQASLTLVEWATTTSTSKQAKERDWRLPSSLLSLDAVVNIALFVLP